VRVLAAPEADCDIAGATVDCDIAGPGCAPFEPLQAARAKAIVSTAAPFSAVDGMWFTFRIARIAPSVVDSADVTKQLEMLVTLDSFVTTTS
jgi:hypothetical protein